ncbi:MAG: hypothetical protein KIT80_17740 [Chitinophagaceae bacterium]|nr:hypothetical protein [Chitinophagaceae bacterium]MCW5928767.1 hypothetical protein [Chitinophagaceae bacterium]
MFSEPLILGILMFQVLYSLVQWYFFKRKEFFLYALYSITIGAYFLLRYQVQDHYLMVGKYRLHEAVLNNGVIYLALCLYIEFARLFVDSPSIIPRLDKWVKAVSWMMYIYMTVGVLWIIAAGSSQFQRTLHLFVSISFFLFFVYGLYRVLMSGSVLGKFLVAGSFLMASGAVTGLIYRVINPEPGLGELNGFFFLQLGVILELVCLNTGLIYKSKKLLDTTTRSSQLIDRQLKENERQLSDLNAVRDEISNELKIELGDGLSGIKLMSDMVQQKMGGDHISELKKISENSERLVQSMNEIVWSLNHLNDDLPGLISYIREYSMGFMDEVGFNCTINVPENIPDINISGDTRRHIFLAVKEALNNAVKHSGSGCTDISFIISDTLQIQIKDHGRGMGVHTPEHTSGNGLRNMKKRMNFLKGSLQIINENGVTILFTIPLEQTIS